MKAKHKHTDGKHTSQRVLLKPKPAIGGPVRVVTPEAEERRLIQKLREIARG